MRLWPLVLRALPGVQEPRTVLCRRGALLVHETLDGAAARAKVEGLPKEREYFELNTRGGPWGDFKDVKAWKAEKR